MRDVIVRGQGMLHAMARPQGTAVAEGENAVAGKCTVEHHLGTGGVILRILDALAAVHHEALKRCLHHAVVKDRGLLAEILLHDVVDGVSAAGSRLLLRHREGVGRIEDGCLREKMRIHVADLVVGLGSRDHAPTIVLTACRRKGQDIHHRQRVLRKHLTTDQIPRLAVILRARGDRLRTIEDAAAAHREDHVDLLLLTDLHTIQHTRIILRIRLNARKLIDLEIREQLLHLIIEPHPLDASATIGEQHPLTKRLHHRRKLRNHTLTENQPRRRYIIKILHNCYLFSSYVLLKSLLPI